MHCIHVTETLEKCHLLYEMTIYMSHDVISVSVGSHGGVKIKSNAFSHYENRLTLIWNLRSYARELDGG